MRENFRLGALAIGALLACASVQAAPAPDTAPAKQKVATTEAGKAINKLVDEYYEA